METLRAAYEMAKKNDGAPGIDGVTFETIEVQGVEALLEQLRDELIGRTYQPLPARRQEIPKDGAPVLDPTDRGDRGNVGIIRSPIRASILPDQRRSISHRVGVRNRSSSRADPADVWFSYPGRGRMPPSA
jgi:hypothetical protein